MAFNGLKNNILINPYHFKPVGLWHSQMLLLVAKFEQQQNLTKTSFSVLPLETISINSDFSVKYIKKNS